MVGVGQRTISNLFVNLNVQKNHTTYKSDWNLEPDYDWQILKFRSYFEAPSLQEDFDSNWGSIHSFHMTSRLYRKPPPGSKTVPCCTARKPSDFFFFFFAICSFKVMSHANRTATWRAIKNFPLLHATEKTPDATYCLLIILKQTQNARQLMSSKIIKVDRFCWYYCVTCCIER